MAKELTSEREALDEARGAINDALGRRWMIAVWSVVNDDKGEPKTIEPVRRITWKFPTGDFERSVDLLRDSFGEEKGAKVPPVPPPLKMADFGVFDGEEEKDTDVAPEHVEPEKSEPLPLVEKLEPLSLVKEGDFPKPLSIAEFMESRERKSAENPSKPEEQQ